MFGFNTLDQNTSDFKYQYMAPISLFRNIFICCDLFHSKGWYKHQVILPKTALEVLFIAFTVSESRTGGLSSANTAALYTPVHLWLVKTKHLFFWAIVCKAKGIDTALLMLINKKPLQENSMLHPISGNLALHGQDSYEGSGRPPGSSFFALSRQAYKIHRISQLFNKASTIFFYSPGKHSF